MKYSFVVALLLGAADAKHHQKHRLIQKNRDCPDHEPLCQNPESYRQTRRTPFAHYAPATYGPAPPAPLAGSAAAPVGLTLDASAKYGGDGSKAAAAATPALAQYQTNRDCPAYEPLCQNPESYRQTRRTPFAHYAPTTYGPAGIPPLAGTAGAPVGLTVDASAKYSANGFKALVEMQKSSNTIPCDQQNNRFDEPLCQQTTDVKHQVVRRDDNVFQHYAPATYGPAPPLRL